MLFRSLDVAAAVGLAAADPHAQYAKDTDLTVDDLKALVATFKGVVKADTGRDFPTDPNEQLDLAIKAVFASWFGKRARDYRNSQKIAHDLGTAVNVVTMVFGNMGDDSGTGVAFTRDPNTGERVLFGEYLTNAQGEDVVAGIRTPFPIAHMAQAMPSVYAEFKAIGEKLERHYRDMQDLEFTIERGRLYMLQTRSAKRTAAAAVKIAIDMVNEGLITKEEAIARIEPAQVDQLLRDQFDQKARAGATRIAKGLNASPGAAVGKAVAAHHHGVPQAGGALRRHCAVHRLRKAAERDVGEHLTDHVPRRHRGRTRSVEDADRKSTRLNSSHSQQSRMPSSA